MNKVLSLLFVCISLHCTAQTPIPKWKLRDLEQAIATTDKPTIFNFWATFCKPCLEELPYFQQVVKKYNAAGLRLVLVNLDMPGTYSKLPAFANRFKITHPIKYLAETNADLFCPVVDPQWSGVIPASLFVDNKRSYRKFFGDQLSKEDFEREVQALLKK